MSDNTSPFEGDAPLLPGGEPELSGTGPQGAYPDGSPEPGDPVVEDTNNVAEGDSAETTGQPSAASQYEDER